ncbi:MAG: hypothetical protein L6Q71_12395, partial [Planctomycetes bacterium]|nr:hypothetical protein [Planctomycetota bacterium]
MRWTLAIVLLIAAGAAVFFIARGDEDLSPANGKQQAETPEVGSNDVVLPQENEPGPFEGSNTQPDLTGEEPLVGESSLPPLIEPDIAQLLERHEAAFIKGDFKLLGEIEAAMSRAAPLGQFAVFADKTKGESVLAYRARLVKLLGAEDAVLLFALFKQEQSRYLKPTTAHIEEGELEFLSALIERVAPLAWQDEAMLSMLESVLSEAARSGSRGKNWREPALESFNVIPAEKRELYRPLLRRLRPLLIEEKFSEPVKGTTYWTCTTLLFWFEDIETRRNMILAGDEEEGLRQRLLVLAAREGLLTETELPALLRRMLDDDPWTLQAEQVYEQLEILAPADALVYARANIETKEMSVMLLKSVLATLLSRGSDTDERLVIAKACAPGGDPHVAVLALIDAGKNSALAEVFERGENDTAKAAALKALCKGGERKRWIDEGL